MTETNSQIKKNLKDITIPIRYEVDIPLKDMADLLVGALEGGSNYWYEIVQYIEPKELIQFDKVKVFKHIDYPFSEGGALIIKDRYDEDEHPETFRLDREAMKKGLQIMAEKYKWHFKNFINGNHDAETSDVFLQCSLFGKGVYS